MKKCPCGFNEPPVMCELCENLMCSSCSSEVKADTLKAGEPIDVTVCRGCARDTKCIYCGNEKPVNGYDYCEHCSLYAVLKVMGLD